MDLAIADMRVSSRTKGDGFRESGKWLMEMVLGREIWEEYAGVFWTWQGI
jgi:hypothetical protein